jgi:hypothetical protein
VTQKGTPHTTHRTAMAEFLSIYLPVRPGIQLR